jgi:HNH endonuclease
MRTGRPPNTYEGLKSNFRDRYTIHPNGCWDWNGKPTRVGYGRISIKTKNFQAHRFSWEIHCGSIPTGCCICHRCDRPICVNPEHLFLGTPLDNTRDMITKGRHRGGKGESISKLSVAQVKAIKANEIDTQDFLAQQHNVSRSLISRIKRNEIWRHV